jgi:putative adhesin
LVEIHMLKSASMQVDNRQGDIQIYLPEKAAFQLSARTDGGEVQSDFTTLSISNKDDQGTGTGTVKGGGPHIVLNNAHGTIEIHKGTAVAEAPSSSNSVNPDSSDDSEPTEN